MIKAFVGAYLLIIGQNMKEDCSEKQGILSILKTFEKFHFVISGKNINDLHSLNIQLKYFTLKVFHFDISGK